MPKSKESGSKKSGIKKPPPPSEETKLIAPSVYEHIFHREVSDEVKKQQQPLAEGLMQPSAMATDDPLYVTEFEKLPPLVEEEMRAFIKSVPKKFTIPEKK